jgi:hypothetical protein
MKREEFMKDVQGHNLSVQMDMGLYRDLVFERPGTVVHSFRLITAPGLLLYTGDMGTYEFERLPDMFEFFRGPIDTGYWAEKCKAADRDGIREFSRGQFRQYAEECLAEYKRSNHYRAQVLGNANGPVRFDETFRQVVAEAENRNDAQTIMEDGNFYPFKLVHAPDIFGSDSWELDFNDFTYRFEWSCHAIQWGIKQYDITKARIK